MRMRVLLLGEETLLGQTLLAQASLESIQIESIACPEGGWSIDLIEHVLLQQRPDMVINLAFYHEQFQLGVLDADQLATQFAFSRSLVDACAAHEVVMFVPSSARVFDGLKSTAYSEKDAVSPADPLGVAQAELEHYLRQVSDEHVILRFSWLLDRSADGLLGRLLGQIRSGDPVRLAEEWRGNPTPIDDAARVMLAILKQLDCDAPLYGTYHYGSAEVSSWISFAKSLAQELLATQQIEADPLVLPVAFSEQMMAGREPQNAALVSRRLLMAFGIKPRAWRAQLGALLQPK